ncbi:MAG TPA: lysozyme [Rhizomicrobium sp.]|nr:lysozyme [Rhizomicrobium sp.]
MFVPSDMTASPRLVEFLKSYEKSPTGGPGLKPYRSPERGSDTVGWGHKILPGEDYSRGLTVAEADQLFLKDLARHQRLVQERVKVPLTQQQFDAMVSLAYNLPAAFNPGPLNTSTLLSKLNEGDYTGAADQLPRWDRGGPKKERMPGLTERRGYERDMFLNGVYTNHK